MGGGFPALRRDVLRWLVTLNLSQPIKNVRRDFSNGFLVAEIFSQYYPQDVHMHSFDNGTKLAKKQDNWTQLEKVFRKKEFPVVPGEIENIINCGPEDGIGPLLERMYWFLARKSCKPQEPQVHDLWTGLPETKSSDTTTVAMPSSDLLPDCKPTECSTREACEEESFFIDLQSSLSSTFSRPMFEDCSRFHDLDKPLDFKADFKARRLDELERRMSAALCDRKQHQQQHHQLQQQEHHHHQAKKKPALNAVERARKKEMKELSKEKSRATKASGGGGGAARHQSPNSNSDQPHDPRLAFRSPNRQRQFKSYTLTDYKRQQALGYVVLGKLGPDSTEELKAKRDNLERMKEFGRSARTIVSTQNAEPRKPKPKPISTRAKALKFASTVPKPKKKEELRDLLESEGIPTMKPLSELEILEAKYQADKEHLESMRKDLEIFLR